jgi:hypothetical protein
MIAGYGCSSGKKSNKQDKKTEDTTSSQKMEVKDFKKMSPDHVAIKGHVLMFNENKPEEAVIKIDEVLGYGSGTPMLAAGQRISASVSDVISSDSTKETDIKAMLTSGKGMIFILNHVGGQLVMGTPKKAQPTWRIQTIQQ